MYLLAKWCASSHIPAALYISMAWFQNNKKDLASQSNAAFLIWSNIVKQESKPVFVIRGRSYQFFFGIDQVEIKTF